MEKWSLMSGPECCPACHPEQSEGSRRLVSEILRFAQDDMRYLQMSIAMEQSLYFRGCQQVFHRAYFQIPR